MKDARARQVARGAMIAALYALLTLLMQPLSFGAIQLRLSEALCALPIVLPEAVPGVAVGCLIANLFTGGVWYDVIFGTLATLLAAYLTRRLRRRRLVAALMPALANGLIVGPVVYLAYTPGTGAVALLSCCGAILLGEAAIVPLLGLPLARLTERLPRR